ncbi:MAG: cytochrome c oxidase subunit II [Holophaga sp.]|jgi:cytochrome c oxidase subunit 2
MTQATTGAQRADLIFLWILGLAVFLLLGITGTMIAFVILYNRKRHPKAEQIHGSTWLEIVWTLVPLVVFIGIFYFGWTGYEFETNAPADSMVVRVTGRQWTWSFEYPNQKHTTVLYVPIGRPMKLEVQSLDVIHGFFVPAFRLKIDAVPGRTNSAWFRPIVTGTYDIQCTVICGVDHSLMLSHVVVVPEDAFRRWYFGDEDAPPPAPEPAPAPVKAALPGEPPAMALLRSHSCLDCHSTDGSVGVGPTLRGLFGQRVDVVEGNRTRTVVVDENHLRRSFQSPRTLRLKGYPDAMPAVTLDPRDREAIVAFIKNLN